MEKAASLQRANQQHRLIEWSLCVAECRTSNCTEQPHCSVRVPAQPEGGATHAFLEGFSGYLLMPGENLTKRYRRFPKRNGRNPWRQPASVIQLEQSLMKLMPEECYTKRLELEKTVLDVLFAWANEPAPKRHPHPPRARRCTIRGSSGPI